MFPISLVCDSIMREKTSASVWREGYAGPLFDAHPHNGGPAAGAWASSWLWSEESTGIIGVGMNVLWFALFAVRH